LTASLFGTGSHPVSVDERNDSQPPAFYLSSRIGAFVSGNLNKGRPPRLNFNRSTYRCCKAVINRRLPCSKCAVLRGVAFDRKWPRPLFSLGGVFHLIIAMKG
jgi:hypothetical protein